jgi:putative FmdB family regulatory protein
MPAYDYDCAACGRRFEVIHGVHAPSPTSCPLCGSGPVRKAITAAAVHYRGSGWAKMERRSGAGSGASKAADTAAPAGEASTSTDGAATPTPAKTAPAKGDSSKGESTKGESTKGESTTRGSGASNSGD